MEPRTTFHSDVNIVVNNTPQPEEKAAPKPGGFLMLFFIVGMVVISFAIYANWREEAREHGPANQGGIPTSAPIIVNAFFSPIPGPTAAP